jgi:hypothetical protein
VYELSAVDGVIATDYHKKCRIFILTIDLRSISLSFTRWNMLITYGDSGEEKSLYFGAFKSFILALYVCMKNNTTIYAPLSSCQISQRTKK